MKVIKEGYTIRIPLPEECGYEGYSVKCTYKYNTRLKKYRLSMWLHMEGIDDDFKIDSQEIDTQYIRGNRETIENNICRIVEQASLSGFFEPYIARFEYTYDCFSKGDDMYEKERIENESINDKK